MSDTSHYELVEQVGTEAAERARWRAVLEKNVKREYTPRIDRVDDAISFAQYAALLLAVASVLLACF